MSFMEWRANNGRGRLLIYSDGMLFRFDSLIGSGASRLENVMVIHEENETGMRQIIIAEQCTVTQDRNAVFMCLRGQITHYTEPLSTRREIFTPRMERHQIGVREY